MRFPLSLTRTMTSYLLRKKLAGEKKFPLVLMLEPLHACNLKCIGCGRIREYAETVGQSLSIDECLASVDECGAPVVSVCGGEPMLYRGVETLVAEIVRRGKHVYLCTNGVLLGQKLPGFRPTSRLFINGHLDGMEATHDRAVQRDGVVSQAVRGIRAAKAAGYDGLELAVSPQGELTPETADADVQALRTAVLGRGLGMNVIAWSRNADPEKAASAGFRYVELDELLSTSDVVSIHLRLTDETEGFINAECGCGRDGA